MKNKIKNINWKDVGWCSLKIFLFILLNTPTIIFVIGKSIDVPVSQNGDGKELTITWIDWLFFYAKNSQNIKGFELFLLKWTFYLSIIGTLYATYKINVFLYKQKKEEKRTQKVIEENGVNTNKIIEAIKSKEEKKEEKDVSKYL